MSFKKVINAFKETLWEAKPLIIFLVLLNVFLFVLSQLFDIPRDFETFVAWVRGFYSDYGYWVVFMSGLVEGVVLLNWYVPGSSAIMLGALFAGEGLLSLPYVILLASLSLALSSSFNYALGRYGWYRLLMRAGFEKQLQEAQSKIQRIGLRRLFWWYFHPHLAAFVSTAAGILGYRFAKFFVFNLAGFLFFGVLWGVSIYFVGPPLLRLVNRFFWPTIIALVTGYILLKIRTKLKNPAR